MKLLVFSLLIPTLMFLASGCGVKGKPQAPLKKSEIKNESDRKKTP